MDHLISSTPTFKTSPKGQLPKYLALETNGACIHKTHNTIADKEKVLRFSPLGSAQSVDRNTNQKEKKLLPEGQASNLADV